MIYIYLKTQEVCFLSAGYILSYRKHLNTPVTSTPTACENVREAMRIQDGQIAQLKGSSILYVGRSKQIAPWR